MLDILKRIKNIIKHRELILRLAFKELKVRYKHPFLGFLWALLVPLFMIAIFKLIFSVIIKVHIENYPFFIFLMTAVFPWNYFNLSVSTSTMSILYGADLIKKIYFPREIIPISIVVVNLINFLLTLIVMLVFLVFFRVRFTLFIFFLPVVVFFQTLLTIGVTLIVSSLQACYRDIKYIVEVLLLAWFYLTPVFYPLTLVAGISKNLLQVYMLNPFVGLITLYRLILLEGYAKSLPPQINISNLVSLCLLSCLAIFFVGFLVFKRYEPKFADLV